MEKAIFANYRKVFEHAWMPIFGQDGFDTEMLLKACDLADIQVIEYTLRRKDADRMIPLLKKRYPQKVVLAGSTIDNEKIVHQLKGKYPQLMTVEELSPYVDGFVSMLPYSDETLKKYSPSHILIPTAETGGEALRQMGGGAAFIKVLGPDFSFSRQLHSVPTFSFCPTYITGGVTPERMEEAFLAGNVLCAAGFDVILKGEDPDRLTVQKAAERIRLFEETALKTRTAVNPKLKGIENLTDEEFVNVLPNYCSVI